MPLHRLSMNRSRLGQQATTPAREDQLHPSSVGVAQSPHQAVTLRPVHRAGGGTSREAYGGPGVGELVHPPRLTCRLRWARASNRASDRSCLSCNSEANPDNGRRCVRARLCHASKIGSRMIDIVSGTPPVSGCRRHHRISRALVERGPDDPLGSGENAGQGGRGHPRRRIGSRRFVAGPRPARVRCLRPLRFQSPGAPCGWLLWAIRR